MLYNAVNGRIEIDGTDMDYISFGRGRESIIVIPGLGDGLKTLKGMAVPFAAMFPKIAAEYNVYAFSRRNTMPEGFSTRDMARDIVIAMDKLGIADAYVVGASLGGMIAEYIAIDYPERVKKLALAVTLARPNPTVLKIADEWMALARAGDYKALMIDTAERSYSPARLKKARLTYSIIGSVGKPKSFSRFLIMAEAAKRHDAFSELDKIKCPTLILGGAEDKIVTPEASYELNEHIAGSTLYMYPNLGHAAYEEAKDFAGRIIAFIKS